MADGMLRSPTFLVGAERQRKNLDDFKRREQQLAEAYHKNKPLCFNGCSYQKTHPVKAQKGHNDADACLTVPLVLGVADGVSQIEDFGIDASLLPNELLKVVEQLGMHQLIPGAKLSAADTYRGPVSMLRRAFEATESLGSLTVVLAVMDNSTRIHGKLHPMIAIITVGDCELIVLRRIKGPHGPLELVCHTEMQRIDGHAQTPLQLARVDDRIDPNFNEELSIEVIERGSAVNCVSAYEGDLVLMGSDGVFDNLFLDEILETANQMLPPKGSEGGYPEAALKAVAQRIVEQCHAKTRPLPNGMLAEAPIGRGGKKDDTSCVVAEVVEWTQDHQQIWTPPQQSGWFNPFDWSYWTSWMNLNGCCGADTDDEGEFRPRAEKLKAKKSQNDWNTLAQPAVPQVPQTPQAPQVQSLQSYQGHQAHAQPEYNQYQGTNGFQGQSYPAYSHQAAKPGQQGSFISGQQGSFISGQQGYDAHGNSSNYQGYQGYQGGQSYQGAYAQGQNYTQPAYQSQSYQGYQGCQGTNGYQVNGYQGSQGNGYQGHGYQPGSANTYQSSGYQASGYANGCQANGYPASGYQGYAATAYQGNGYQGYQACQSNGSIQYPMNGTAQQSFAASNIYSQAKVPGNFGVDPSKYNGAGRY